MSGRDGSQQTVPGFCVATDKIFNSAANANESSSLGQWLEIFPGLKSPVATSVTRPVASLLTGIHRSKQQMRAPKPSRGFSARTRNASMSLT